MNPWKKIAMIITITLVVCQGIFLLMEKGMRNYYKYPIERLTTLLTDTTNYNMLFLGTSRTYRHVNPAIIDSICHTKSYNGGMEGANLLENKMLLEAYLENHSPPQYLVLTLDIAAFDLDRKFFDAPIYFLFLKNRVVYRTLTNNGYTLFPAKVFPFFIFTEMDDYKRQVCLSGLAGSTSVPDSLYRYHGFLSPPGAALEKGPVMAKGTIQTKISDSSIAYLHDIIGLCTKNNTKLIFTYSPEYKQGWMQLYNNYQKVLDTIRSISHRYHIPYFRHDSLSLCSDPQMFSSPNHLNAEGAALYSKILGKDLLAVSYSLFNKN